MRRPMRLTNGLMNHAKLIRREIPKPTDGNAWYRLKNLSTGVGQAELYIYDEIGMWGVTAYELIKELQGLEAVHIDLRINSEGGDVWDGIAIYNALCTHPASVTTYVDGLAASAASFIAQAGSKVLIARNGTMMIHDASGFCIGNAQDMTDTAELLDRTSNNIADIYAQRCSTVNVWRKAMKAASWYVGQEAVDAGLADEAYEPEQGTDAVPAERRRRAANAAPVIVNRRPQPVSMACPSHGTETTDEGEWDANAEQEKLPSPMTIATARKMYAWYDGSRVEDGELPKDAGSLPHHVCSDDGNPGAAHMGGVRSALSLLSQSDIPDDEQDAVREHLNKHLEDGGGTPSEDSDGSGTGDSTDGLADIASWWNPDVFKTAVATAADLHGLYGFNAGMFREAIRAVAEDMPALEEPAPESRELEPGAPTISVRQFSEAIKKGLL